MKLTIRLPTDRALLGTALLAGDDGAVLLSGMDARGKADSSIAELHKNPTRDPKMPYGDSPYGIWHGCKVVKIAPPKNGVGDAWIPLDRPFSGDAVQAHINGRKGLGVHAGRGNHALVSTKGCVRMRDSDFKGLCGAIGTREFEVEVTDTEPAAPGIEETRQ